MATNGMEFEKAIVQLEKKIEELRKFTDEKKIDFSEEIKKLETKAEELKKEVYQNLTAWRRVLVSRNLNRPRTLDYISRIFEDFLELHGDRAFRDDPAVIGGLAKFEGESVVIVGFQKGKDTKDSVVRNFGMANPEGYRKAIRLMKMAEKFQRHIISFVDTPAAYPGIGAEERGQALAIAENLRDMSAISVPIIVIVHGEGGSGGALGIAIGDKIFMLENAVYSVIPPEGCAAILWKDSSKAEQAAEFLKLTSKDLLKFGVIDAIIPEPLGGAHRNYDKAAEEIKKVIKENLAELKLLSKDELVKKRYLKFRKMGEYTVKQTITTD